MKSPPIRGRWIEIAEVIEGPREGASHQEDPRSVDDRARLDRADLTGDLSTGDDPGFAAAKQQSIAQPPPFVPARSSHPRGSRTSV